MSEEQTRSSTSRGRGSSTRSGRGGRSSRGGSRSLAKDTNGDTAAALALSPLEDQGELGQLKLKYKDQLGTLKELFPDWTDDDLVFALQETDGDLPNTIERISEGNVSRFSDVKKKTKEKPKTTSKEEAAIKSTTEKTSTRGGRGRGGAESIRGGRGRGADRARSRGGRTAASSTARAAAVAASVPTIEPSGWGDSTNGTKTAFAEDPVWGDSAAKGASTSDGQWGSVVASTATPVTASEGTKSSLIPEGTKKSWASMLAESKPAALKVPSAAPPIVEPDVTAHDFATQPTTIVEAFATPVLQVSDGTTDLTPPKDRLTEDNLEHLPDSSAPAPAGTVASTLDPNSAAGTPYGSTQHLPMGRVASGAYVNAAWKGAGGPVRSASFQRRIMEQREAVVMPGNHAVDRTAVQFGSLGLNGEAQDVDDEREEAETRVQPQQTPPSQPRTALPPSQQPSLPTEPGLHDPAIKQAPGLGQPLPQQQPTQHALAAQQAGLESQLPQTGADNYQQYRYGGTGHGNDPRGVPQKAYDPFSQQLNYPHASQDSQASCPSQAPATQQQEQSHVAAYSQAPGDFASQYATDQQRSSYGSYQGGAFGQQASHQQEQAVPQCSGSAFGATDSGFGSGLTQTQSRFNDSRGSGQATPNPPGAGAQQVGSQAQGQLHQQGHGQASHGYPYNQPYYSGYGYGSYMNNYPNYSYNQGYNTHYGNKGNVYGQPHHGYGMPAGSSYDQSSSPANAMRESSYSGTAGDFNRSSSAQPQNPQQAASAGTPNYPDPYGRSSSGFQAGNQQAAGQGYGQSGASGEENLRPYDTASGAATGGMKGASPALGQQPTQRAGSATNDRFSMQDARFSGSQSGFGPQASYAQGHQQQGFGAAQYQMHGSHGAGAYGGAGVGGQQHAHGHAGQTGGYGNYSGFSGYGSYQRGGWGGNYGHQ